MDNYMNEDSRRHFSSVAFGFGIASMVSGIILGIFPNTAIQFGCCSILFGFISKGFYYKRDQKARLGLIFSLVGILIALFSFGTIFMRLAALQPSAMNSALDYTEVFEIYDSLFGDFCMEEFGLKASEMIKYLMSYGGLINVY